jgi:hypothetical protein
MRPDVVLPSDVRQPIFIGGQRRSGTTLLRALLNRHSNIACGPESKFVQHPTFLAWHDQLSNEWAERVERYGFGQREVDQAMAALVDDLFSRYARKQGKTRWAEKTPTNILRIDYVFRLFPHAKFLHIIRDPRDTFCSIRHRARTDKPAWARFTANRSAVDWCDSIRAGKPWRTSTERYFELHYENLVADPQKVLQDILRFIGEPWDPRLLDPDADDADERKNKIRRDQIVSTSVGRWRAELERVEVEDIQSTAGPLMIELGYALA